MSLVNIQSITFETIKAESKHARVTSDTLTIAEAKRIAGSLSATSKMPCCSYGLPPESCITGSKLRAVQGTICSHCYACKGCYTMYKDVKPSQKRRLASITHPMWSAAMVRLITSNQRVRKHGRWVRVTEKLFRWHDSGDLQSIAHLARIVAIAYALPDYKFWLPTREVAIMRQWFDQFGKLPSNLIVRMSAAKVDSPAPVFLTGYASTAHSTNAPDGAHTCTAYRRDGDCGKCRVCFNKNVAAVSYPLH